MIKDTNSCLRLHGRHSPKRLRALNHWRGATCHAPRKVGFRVRTLRRIGVGHLVEDREAGGNESMQRLDLGLSVGRIVGDGRKFDVGSGVFFTRAA